MPSPESTLPADWFAYGDQDLQAAEILLTAHGPLTIVAFLLQQTLEKYLKGYLFSQGWSLRRIHDLEVLVQEAIAYDPAFAPFLAPCQQITEYYIESRYPIGNPTFLDHFALEADLVVVQDLVRLIRFKLSLPT